MFYDTTATFVYASIDEVVGISLQGGLLERKECPLVLKAHHGTRMGDSDKLISTPHDPTSTVKAATTRTVLPELHAQVLQAATSQDHEEHQREMQRWEFLRRLLRAANEVWTSLNFNRGSRVVRDWNTSKQNVEARPLESSTWRGGGGGVVEGSAWVLGCVSSRMLCLERSGTSPWRKREPSFWRTLTHEHLRCCGYTVRSGEDLDSHS